MKKTAIALQLFLLLLTLLANGCAPGRIDRIVKNGMAISGKDQAAVLLIRQGQTAPAGQATMLKQGDEVQTLPGVTAIVWLQGGSQVILAPETHIRLVNPNHIIELLQSTGKAIGRIFVKAKSSLRVDTSYASASTEGTEFQVTLDPNDKMKVTVLSGGIRFVSRYNQFAPLRLGRLEEVAVTPGVTPRKLKISREQANDIIRWVNTVERNAGMRTTARLVPDVSGLPLEAALEKLQMSSFAVGKTVVSIQGNAPLQTVLSQQPPAGSRVGGRGSITLVYKAEARTVPKLIGLPQNLAMEELRGLRLIPGRITPKITGTTETGMVLEQNPKPFQQVAVESRVDLVVEAESVEVPSLVGATLEEANYRLARLRLRPSGIREEMTGRYAAGTVIRQSPEAMRRVAPGTGVTLTVETESVLVPRLEKYHIDQARQILEKNGLRLGSRNSTFVPRMAAGTVINQSPSAGTRVKKNTPVSITVAEEAAVVPNLVGMPYDQAASRLHQAGLQTGNIRYEERRQPAANTVLWQSVTAGSHLQRGSRISLTLSKQPVLVAPVVAPPVFQPVEAIKVCFVPNIKGQYENAAVSTIRNAGLVPKRLYLLGGKQVVTTQNPNAGQSVSCGSTVTYSIGTLQ